MTDDRSVATALGTAVPTVGQFVFQRWAELHDDDPPWWSRPSGVGLRLLLEELGELAVARSSGAIAKEAVAALIEEARRYLFADGSLCRRRYLAASDSIRSALTDKSSENWLPGAAGPSAMAAALVLIDGEEFIPTLLAVIQEEVDKADAVVGENELAQALSAVEPFVELLDAELVRDGHSRRWRQGLCVDAKRRADEGLGIGAAIGEALKGAGYGDVRDFDCFVVVGQYQEPELGRLGFDALAFEDALVQIIRPWNTDDLEATLAELGGLDIERLIRYTLKAPDIEAAARTVSHDFTRDADLWRLRGGLVSGNGESSVLIYDARQLTARLLKLPVEPLDVLPRRLGSYAPEPGDDPTRIDDALVQLAQARLAPPATAIVNVWTAAEALFGGVVGESRADTIDVVAGLGEFLYLLDLFRWLGDRYSDAGLEGAPPGGSSRWGLERTLEKTTDVLAALVDKGDALGWWRLKVVTGWRSPPRLREQLAAFGQRVRHVGARAYLARNTVVHNAAVRRRLIDVTLPPFAAVVRECVGHVANEGMPDETLKTAMKSAVVVTHVANRVAAEEVAPAAGVESLLPDEPGTQGAEVEAEVKDDAHGGAAPGIAGEPVPVEELGGAQLVPGEAGVGDAAQVQEHEVVGDAETAEESL
jgi:hypothetical protein